jgi:hypothetical protein
MQKELKTQFTELQIYGKYYSFVLFVKLILITNEWKESLNPYFHIFKAYLESVYRKRT